MAGKPVSRIRQATLKRSKLFEINRRPLSVMSVLAAMVGSVSHGRHNQRPSAYWAAETAIILWHELKDVSAAISLVSQSFVPKYLVLRRDLGDSAILAGFGDVVKLSRRSRRRGRNVGSGQESDRAAILCGLSKNHEFGLLYGHALGLQ